MTRECKAVIEAMKSVEGVYDDRRAVERANRKIAQSVGGGYRNAETWRTMRAFFARERQLAYRQNQRHFDDWR